MNLPDDFEIVDVDGDGMTVRFRRNEIKIRPKTDFFFFIDDVADAVELRDKLTQWINFQEKSD